MNRTTTTIDRSSQVTINGLPGVLQLGRVAECVATVRNRSARSMTLQLQFRTDGMVGVYVHGQSFRNLGTWSGKKKNGASVVVVVVVSCTSFGRRRFLGVCLVRLRRRSFA